jgi:hypothetical protein
MRRGRNQKTLLRKEKKGQMVEPGEKSKKAHFSI